MTREPDLAVQPSERITRYILDRSKFKPGKIQVKFTAFMPPPNGELSVYRTISLSEPEVWQIGSDYVASVTGKTLYARADVRASAIFDLNLRIISAPEPHPRHANIVDWPGEDGPQRVVAMQLAEGAELVLKAQ